MNRFAPLLLVGLASTGCRMGPLGPYTSPRITGCVLAAESGMPLGDVQVIRGRLDRSPPGGQPKGGELMMRKTPVRTQADGKFTLQSERVLSIFRGAGWNQVRLTFQRAGYETLKTNYSTWPATNAPQGEPVLDVGEIRLQPVPKQGALHK